MFNIFKWFKPKPSTIQTRINVFENIYASLLEDWNTSADLSLCEMSIDVSQFPESLDEWVKVINSNVHVYNMTQFNIQASTRTERGFLSCKEILVVKLLEPPYKITGSIKA